MLALLETTRGPSVRTQTRSTATSGTRKSAQLPNCPSLPYMGGEADSSLPFIFSFTHNFLPHCALVGTRRQLLITIERFFRGFYVSSHKLDTNGTADVRSVQVARKKMKKKYFIYLLKLLILDYLPITSVILKKARREADISSEHTLC